jgi:hypothetical protein
MTMVDGTEQSTFAIISQMKLLSRRTPRILYVAGEMNISLYTIYVWFSKPYYKNQAINMIVT